MIKRLHVLVFKSYIGPLIMTFFIAEFVLIMHFLWLYIGDLVGKGLAFADIAELLLYSSANIVKMALPLAILLASIMTFGSLGENFELSAMKSAGISLQRIMMPLTIFSIVLSIGLFFFSNYIIPYTNLKFGSLLYDITNQRPEMNIKPGIVNADIDGFRIKIKSKNPRTNMMYDLMVWDHRDRRGNVMVTLADSGSLAPSANQKYMIITLYQGKCFKEEDETDMVNRRFPETRDFFDKQVLFFEVPSKDLERTNPNLFKQHYQMKSLWELQKSADSLAIRLNTRKLEFDNTLSRTRFFKYEKRNIAKDSSFSHKDSLRRMMDPRKMAVLENFDSVFSKMNDQEKTTILNSSIESADALKKFIESNKEDIYERGKTIHKHKIAWHEKFSLSFACLIFFFIGAPLGAIIRKGGFGLPFIVSILFFITYYIVSMMGKKFVEEGVWVPWMGMWLSSAITLPLGVLFTYKATTDSTLFDVGAYFEFLKRPFKVLEIKFKDPTVVFHKDIEIPENTIIHANKLELDKQANLLILSIDGYLRSFKQIYFRHFTKSRTEILAFIDAYNSLYNILSVKFRDRKFEKAALEQFPRIDAEKYEMTQLKLRGNYILLTIGIFPVGLLILLNSYLKIRVLKQKIEMVTNQLKSFDKLV